MSLKAGVATLYALRPAAAFSIAACAKKPCTCTHIWCGSHLPRCHMMPFSKLTCVAGVLLIASLQMRMFKWGTNCSRLVPQDKRRAFVLVGEPDLALALGGLLASPTVPELLEAWGVSKETLPASLFSTRRSQADDRVLGGACCNACLGEDSARRLLPTPVSCMRAADQPGPMDMALPATAPSATRFQMLTSELNETITVTTWKHSARVQAQV